MGKTNVEEVSTGSTLSELKALMDQLQPILQDPEAEDFSKKEKACRAAIAQCLSKLELPPQIDEDLEPVLHRLYDLSKRGHQAAAQILVGQMGRKKLRQERDKAKPPLPDPQININGMGFVVPRGMELTLPVSFIQLLDDADLY